VTQKIKRRHFPTALKLKILEDANALGLTQAAVKYAVTNKLIGKWRTQFTRRLNCETPKPVTVAPTMKPEVGLEKYVQYLEKLLAEKTIELERMRFQKNETRVIRSAQMDLSL